MDEYPQYKILSETVRQVRKLISYLLKKALTLKYLKIIKFTKSNILISYCIYKFCLNLRIIIFQRVRGFSNHD